MKREEAIPILHDMYNYYNDSDVDGYVGFDKEDNEALELAIKALEQETNKEELPTWLGKRCEDCGNKRCKELGKLPKGYDCALWQSESEGEE